MSRRFPIFQFDVPHFVERMSGQAPITPKFGRSGFPPEKVQFRKGKVRWLRMPRTQIDQKPDELGRVFVEQHFALVDLKTDSVHLYFQFGFVQSKGSTWITFPSFPVMHRDSAYLVLMYVPACWTDGISVADFYGHCHPAHQVLNSCRAPVDGSGL